MKRCLAILLSIIMILGNGLNIIAFGETLILESDTIPETESITTSEIIDQDIDLDTIENDVEIIESDDVNLMHDEDTDVDSKIPMNSDREVNLSEDIIIEDISIDDTEESEAEIEMNLENETESILDNDNYSVTALYNFFRFVQ